MIIEYIFLLLPLAIGLAQMKLTLFGLPLYALELLFLFSCGVLILSGLQKKVKIEFKGDVIFLVGAGLFVLGAVISTVYNTPTLRSFGQLKSWVIFPVVVFGFFSLTDLTAISVRKSWYQSVFLGLLAVALVALFGFLGNKLTYDGRLAFPDTSPNFLAFLVSWGLVISIYLFLTSQEKFTKLVTGLGGILFITTLYLTHSYNAWLAVVVLVLMSVGYASLGYLKSHRNLVMLSMLVIAIVLGVVFFVEQSTKKWENLFLHDGRSSVDSRIMIWKSAAHIVSGHPLWGIGMGNFQEQYLSYQQHFPPYLEWAVPQPHNLWLALWLQAGLLGLLGFGIFLIRSMFLLVRKLRSSIKKEEGILHLLLLGLFLLYGLFDTPYFRNDLAFLFWFQMVLLVSWLEERD